jgi:hypothetical protein
MKRPAEGPLLGHMQYVKKLFFDSLPDELVAPFTAALEHIQGSLNLNSALPPVPLYPNRPS